jgi:SAM-dependent MidA family methyltransferase
LARHILDFAARALPSFYAAAEYIAVERSSQRRAAHRDQLVAHVQAGRVRSAETLPGRVPTGCIFSNELLDALPVHRVICQHGELREIYVGLDGESFADQVGPLSTPAIAMYFAQQGVTLAEAQQAEANLAATQWLEEAGRVLGCGFVLTVDYGHEARELYSERRLRGTLLAYRQHHAAEDFYAAPGQQDLTAHVSFTALEVAGKCIALQRTGRVSQSRFLTALGRANEFADLYHDGQSELERMQARQQLKELVHPEGMGETFQVLIQHKGITAPQLTGLAS